MSSNKNGNDKAFTSNLWLEYKKKPTSALRNLLVEQYTPLVHKIVRTFNHKRPNVLDYDDLFQAGRIGLLDAIEKFDPNNSKGAQFQTYATFRIKGAILDEINSMDWTPRSVRQNIKEVLKTIETYYADHGQEPTVADVAAKANIDMDTAKLIMGQIQKTYIVQFENEIIDFVGPTTDHEKTEMESLVNIAMNKALNEVEKDFVTLKYFMGYNNREIQDILDVKSAELKSIRENALSKLTVELDNPSHLKNIDPEDN